MEGVSIILSKKQNSDPQTLSYKTYKRWTQQENTTYALFLLNCLSDFTTQWKRRSTKVYLRLAKLIETKSVNQCKSHHQKMLKYCRSIPQIISRFLPKQALKKSRESSHLLKEGSGDQLRENISVVKEEPRENYTIDVSNLYLGIKNGEIKVEGQNYEAYQMLPVLIVTGEGKNI